MPLDNATPNDASATGREKKLAPAISGWRFLWRRIAATAAFVSVGIGLITVAGYGGGVSRFFDHCANFRPQLLAAGLLTLPILITLHRWRMPLLLMAGFGITLNAVEVAPWFFAPPNPPKSISQPLTIFMANVYAANTKYTKLTHAVKNNNPDIVLLIEVNSAWLRTLNAQLTDWPYVLARPREDNFGIAIFSKRPFLNQRVEQFGTAKIPSLIATIQLNAQKIILVGTHPLPPVSAENFTLRNQQLAAISRFIATQHDPVLLMGDLNTTPWSVPYKKLERVTGLTNARRGTGLLASWPTRLPLIPTPVLAPLRIPIDHVMYSRHFSLAACKLGEDFGSDHFPMILQLNIHTSLLGEVVLDDRFPLQPNALPGR